MQTTIKVIDALPGAGKTTYIERKMNKEHNRKWIYITPYINEVKRVIQRCPKCNFVEPTIRQENKVKYNKSDNLFELVSRGVNICSTHSLFQDLDAETAVEIGKKGYSLVLDEVMQVVESIPLGRDQVDALFERGFFQTVPIRDSSGKRMKGIERVVSVEDSRLDSMAFEEGSKLRISLLRKYADMNRLVKVSNQMMFWLFPCDLLYVFKEIFNLTYCFEGSYQKYFYELHEIDFEPYSILGEYPNFTMVDYDPKYDIAKKKLIKNLINLYEGDRNTIGYDNGSFSHTWWNPERATKYKGKRAEAGRVRRSRENKMGRELRAYFKTDLKLISNGKRSKAMWTCFKNQQGRKHKRTKEILPQVFVKDFPTRFVVMNQRATNNYRDRKHLAYLCNRYPQKNVEGYFKAFGYEVDGRAFGLCELLQWLFRSALRDDKPVDLYLPSWRMRDILQDWFIGESEGTGSVEVIKN
jgi:hypothetical protein